MIYKAVVIPTKDGELPRNSIASAAWMSPESSIPKCKCCESSMQLFLQFDVERRFALPFREGSHFVLFMCPQCNEVPSFERFSEGSLPLDYWLKTEGNHFAALYRPGVASIDARGDNWLQSFGLNFDADEHGLQPKPYISVGGAARWIQSEEKFTCSCGAQMSLLTQISENFPFPKLPSSPSQPDSFSKDDYCLFLGNEVYVFACENQCSERSIWITVQN